MLSTATPLAGIPRLIYIAPAHQKYLNKIEDNTGVDITATGIVNNIVKTTTSNPELIMFEQTTYDLPDAYLLRALDDAHEKGFRDFLRDHRYDARCQADRKQAADALSNLINGLKKGSVPNYYDPHVAAAYIVNYHLSHCMMAFWAFKGIFDRVDVPNTLYVYDVGAGTGAGRVGLALALSKYDKQPDIYFGAHEPANAMRTAGYFFWQAFRKSVPDYFKDPYIYTHPKEPSKLPVNTVRVVAAFHLSLPWYEPPWDRYEYEVRNAKKNVSSG